MKVTILFCVLACIVHSAVGLKTQDRTITRVVKLLQGMLDKSKTDGEEERVLYAKYKCYCDTQTEEKSNSIKELNKQIELLGSKIQEERGSNGEASTECAKLKSDMADNEASRNTAEALRNQEHEDFVAATADMTAAIAQMKDAIEVLASVGGDQTLSEGEDHKRFMANYPAASLVSVKAKVQKAMIAASAFLSPVHQKTVQSFIQGPFTGNYASQSGQVVGILKNMLDTFESNLSSAQSKEEASQKAYDAFMKEQVAAFNEMSDSYDGKQDAMATSDNALASAKEQLASAKAALASDTEFLDALTPMCAQKTKEYEGRKMLRANEEAAIAEAVAILNSDSAFATFGKVDATSTGATEAAATGPSFLQLAAKTGVRNKLQQLLRATSSKRLAKVAQMIKANNPFDVVLAEIDKMLALIQEEAKGDSDNLNWCNSERVAQDAAHAQAVSDIETLSEEINTLTNTIEDPQIGLLVQIANDEASLEENKESQTQMTASRAEENKVYQEDIATLVESQELLKGAINVLTKYYEKIDSDSGETAAGPSFSQTKEDPAPPPTWDASYSGQSDSGNSAISMLNYILSEAKKEEDAAHTAENEAQTTYEDQMTELKSQEAQLLKNLADLQENLAATKKELGDKVEEKKKTEAQKAAIEAYLLKIKPGCDFITENYDLRESHRAQETTALENAKTLIKGTPTYQAAVAEAHVEELGDCKAYCEDEARVECKACLAEVTVPGYCAGHPDTLGCDEAAAPAAA